MSTTLEPADLTGATVGTTGSVDLTQVTGPGGISWAQGGQATLRLHNESNCGLRCFFDNSGQSFNLPAGGWSDCFPKSSDNALNFSVLYTLSSPGVTLLLSTYYYPGEPVPAQTTLGNSPIGGGNVSTNFSELINTGNNPLSTLINVQPNDASTPTWSADNSGNFSVFGDNGGVLTQLLQLIAGASPAVKLAAAGVLTEILGNLQIDGATVMANGKPLQWKMSNGTPWSILFLDGSNNVGLQAAQGAGNQLRLKDQSGTTQMTIADGSPQVTLTNDLTVGGIVDIAGKVSVLNGSAGGTCTLYEAFGGSGYKKVLLVFNNFRTQLATQFLPIPVPFTTAVMISSGDIGTSANIAGLSFEKSNVLQTLEILTALAVGGGARTSATTLYGMSFATCASGLDLIVSNTGSGASMNGLVIMEGI